MARKIRTRKDRTSLVISLVFHGLLIAGVVYWAHKSGQFEKIRQVLLQYAGEKQKKQKKEEPKQIQQKAQPPKLPPINQGLPQQSSGGSRRAVAVDAPSATGESFFQDTRRQVQGPSTAGSGGPPKAPPARSSSTASAGPSSACLCSSAPKHGQAVVGGTRESDRVHRGRGCGANLEGGRF